MPTDPQSPTGDASQPVPKELACSSCGNYHMHRVGCPEPTLLPNFQGRPERIRYFHGGHPGLRTGNYILPSSVTGSPCTADFGAHEVCRRDRVYLVSDAEVARAFAALHPSGRGEVYEVLPEGAIIPDPDCTEPGLSWECERAYVLRVVAPPGIQQRPEPVRCPDCSSLRPGEHRPGCPIPAAVLPSPTEVNAWSRMTPVYLIDPHEPSAAPLEVLVREEDLEGTR